MHLIKTMETFVTVLKHILETKNSIGRKTKKRLMLLLNVTFW